MANLASTKLYKRGRGGENVYVVDLTPDVHRHELPKNYSAAHSEVLTSLALIKITKWDLEWDTQYINRNAHKFEQKHLWIRTEARHDSMPIFAVTSFSECLPAFPTTKLIHCPAKHHDLLLRRRSFCSDVKADLETTIRYGNVCKLFSMPMSKRAVNILFGSNTFTGRNRPYNHTANGDRILQTKFLSNWA